MGVLYGEHGVNRGSLKILKTAVCSKDTEALPRTEFHHALTQQGLEHIIEEEKSFGGALGRSSGARLKTFERLKRYRESVNGDQDLFVNNDWCRRLDRAIEDIYRYPLYQATTDALNRQFRVGINDRKLAELVLAFREDGRLCVVEEAEGSNDPKLICSMGLV